MNFGIYLKEWKDKWEICEGNKNIQRYRPENELILFLFNKQIHPINIFLKYILKNYNCKMKKPISVFTARNLIWDEKLRRRTKPM